MNNLKERLKANNLKITPRRISIYTYLVESKSHPTAEEIYKNLREEYPNMSLATVYKTLDTFKKNGLVKEINTKTGFSRFDGNTMLHAHLICTECDGLEDAGINMSELQLSNKIINSNHFNIDSLELLVYGKCSKCK